MVNQLQSARNCAGKEQALKLGYLPVIPPLSRPPEDQLLQQMQWPRRISAAGAAASSRTSARSRRQW